MARVYEIEIGGTRYIGYTSNPNSRLLDHLTDLEAGTHWNTGLQSAYDLTGGRTENVRFRFRTPQIPMEAARAEEARLVSEDPALVNIRRLGTHAVPGKSPKRLAREALADRIREMEAEGGLSLTAIGAQLGLKPGQAHYLARKVYGR